MSKEIVSRGEDFVVEQVDRDYLGSRKEALKVDGDSGAITISVPVTFNADTTFVNPPALPANDYGTAGDMATFGATSANAAGVSPKVARIDHAHAVDPAVVATLTGAQELTNKTVTAQVVKNGLTATGVASNDFSGSTGAFKTSTGLNTFGGKAAYGATTQLVADPGDAGAISVVANGVCALTSGALAETRTLAIPAFVGQRLSLVLDTDGGGDVAVTVASAFNQAGNTVITLGDAGDFVDLVGVTVGGVSAWRLVANDGTVLS